MALQLSNPTKNKCLNYAFRPVELTLYAMIPAAAGSGPSTYLPRAEINFYAATTGQISLGSPVQLAVQAGTTVNAVYLHTDSLRNDDSVDAALVRIDLTGDDVEVYENNGVYIINTINVAINT